MSSITEGEFRGLPTPTEGCFVSELLDSESVGYFLAVKLVGLVEPLGIFLVQLVDNFVQIIPFLETNGNLLPDCLERLKINVCHDNVLSLPRLSQYVPPGSDDG